MSNELARVPRVAIGAGVRSRIGELAAAHAGGGEAVLLVADPGVEKLGLVDEAEDSLSVAELKPHRFTAFTSDPTLAHADAAAAIARRHGARVVVALGGGSALDLGKTVAASFLRAGWPRSAFRPRQARGRRRPAPPCSRGRTAPRSGCGETPSRPTRSCSIPN
jgi:alcohol dehydrogenase class IV